VRSPSAAAVRRIEVNSKFATSRMIDVVSPTTSSS